MHEMDRRTWEQAADERDLRDRRAIKMAPPAIPNRAQYGWLRITFHGVEHVATECLHEGDFVVDSETELNKIIDVLATRDAAALNAKPGLFIRLDLQKTGAAIDRLWLLLAHRV
jgi:hypothetical protein